MLVYEKGSEIFVFIHVPKTAGKTIRDQIKQDSENRIIEDHWGVVGHLDSAHIPYRLCTQYAHARFFAYVRNPYDRLISAFFYLNPDSTIHDFKRFVAHDLSLLDFNSEYCTTYIHYYPQYTFVTDEYSSIPDNINVYILEDNLVPPTYNLKDYFDEVGLDQVNRIYKMDFLLFGYIPLLTFY